MYLIVFMCDIRIRVYCMRCTACRWITIVIPECSIIYSAAGQTKIEHKYTHSETNG